MLKIAVCDDVPEFAESVTKLLNDHPEQKFDISFFSRGYSLVEAHSLSPFDIIFLDVLMPTVNGIEAASDIRKTDKLVKIVFLSSSSEYALDSYSVKANGYLLKPVNKDKFYTLLDELCEELSATPKHIFIKSTHTVHKIPINSIEYAEAQGKHVRILLSNGTMILSDNPFYYFKNSLIPDDGFVSCHRSYIVNINHISTYTAKEIILNSGVHIPISRSCHKEFESIYFETTFGKVDDIL